ncbi:MULTISPECIES: D-hexose-6-phosphate mutarotase [unclassified Gilliamella]|uniref:D-hexose-6-phosphate mutarotase n=1 Tax=unclassified Gilliamella TaxID=2685620 RepID=UPI001306CBCB|nr:MULTISPECIES: D-hexose-6-phosphate mutarotase [unclassified Gilliamella]MWP48418.1 D-hexose-6-phosphate mutarotase [Gilliamella sp. Lep-s35]MWP68303.1 D-hexose-6-phosphate mutarotase [Gilliamella sp. Lep-s5]MWP76558.1 D-hexose-6-phosphate mutarotase [Gilliamella sp. Lep-s21]
MSIYKEILDSSLSGVSLSPSVKQSIYGELPILVINHSTCCAAVALQGAHLLFWHPSTEQTPVVWLSNKTNFKKTVAIRGGVPVCWPWFGQLGNPSHGFARLVEWKLDSCEEDENGVDLVLSLTNNPQTESYCNKPFSASLNLHLGKTCEVSLSCSADFDVTSALHTYFGVDNIDRVVVKGLGEAYQERLAAENKPTTVGQLIFNQEVDRIYTNASNRITITDGNRTIQLTNTNVSDVVTWNPWINKAKSMADFGDDEYKSMVCVEAGCITKPLKLLPNKKSTYGFKIELI